MKNITPANYRKGLVRRATERAKHEVEQHIQNSDSPFSAAAKSLSKHAGKDLGEALVGAAPRRRRRRKSGSGSGRRRRSGSGSGRKRGPVDAVVADDDVEASAPLPAKRARRRTSGARRRTSGARRRTSGAKRRTSTH